MKFPDGWKTLKVSDIGEIMSGGTPATNDIGNWNGTIFWLTPSEVTKLNGKFIHRTKRTITQKGLSSTTLLPKGCLIVCTRATIGACCINSVPMAINQGFKCVKPNPGYSVIYMYYCFQLLKNNLVRVSSGNTFGEVSKKDFGELLLSFPPLPEQKTIADILQTWDTAIEKTEALIAAKEKQFDWFRQNVLTGLIRIKDYCSPWKYQLFRDVLTEHKLVSTGKEDVHSVSVHKGVINQIKHLGRSFSAKSTQHYNLVKPGDIIYTKSPTGDFPYGIIKQSKLQENVIVSPLYGVFSPRTYELGTILDAYFESSTYTSNYLRPVIQKGAKNTISCKNTSFLSRGLLLPTEVEEEHSIAEHINTAKREIDTLKALADQYRTQKRGLMQKLLTGKWRVKV